MSGARRCGLLAPLFSLTSSRSWGVGEFGDLPVFAEWARSAGQSVVQVLPITEVPEHVTSPYSSLTAMALDPLYITVPAVADFAALGGEASLDAADRDALDAVRRAPRVEHRAVRAVKTRALARAYEWFSGPEGQRDAARVERFGEFVRGERWWLDEYVLFQAIRARQSQLPWWDWPPALAQRDAAALAEASRVLHAQMDQLRYIQWIAAEQWMDARRRSHPVEIFGDLPFMISADSPDVWARQAEFRFDATVGVPPDAFSETGQDWGLPPWRWQAMARNDFIWMRARARRMADLFDGFRLDHLVGLYRTYIRPIDKARASFFAPADEPTQLALGERLVGIYQQSRAEIVAEDLGTVPDFVRHSLTRLQVPGFKVLRWEREWTAPDQPFIDPASYPELAVATTGTHDTEPLVVWWRTLSQADRMGLLQTPSINRRLALDAALAAAEDDMPPSVIDAVIAALVASDARLVILPLQDVFGWEDRINTPALVNDENWTWRMRYPVDTLDRIPEVRARAEELRRMAREEGRGKREEGGTKN